MGAERQPQQKDRDINEHRQREKYVGKVGGGGGQKILCGDSGLKHKEGKKKKEGRTRW